MNCLPQDQIESENKDKIKHTFNIQHFLVRMVDLLHVTIIKGDRIMEMFSFLNSISPVELME